MSWPGQWDVLVTTNVYRLYFSTFPGRYFSGEKRCRRILLDNRGRCNKCIWSQNNKESLVATQMLLKAVVGYPHDKGQDYAYVTVNISRNIRRIIDRIETMGRKK